MYVLDVLKDRFKICSSGGKQTIHKVSAASIVKKLPSSNILMSATEPVHSDKKSISRDS